MGDAGDADSCERLFALQRLARVVGRRESEREEVTANIRAVPLPDADPVQGREGPLTRLWK